MAKHPYSVAEMRAANLDAGYFFFDRKTMRFFGDTLRSFAPHTFGDGTPGLRRVRSRRGAPLGSLYRFDPATGDITSYQFPNREVTP